MPSLIVSADYVRARVQEKFIEQHYRMGVAAHAYVFHDKGSTVPDDVSSTKRNSLGVCHPELVLHDHHKRSLLRRRTKRDFNSRT